MHDDAAHTTVFLFLACPKLSMRRHNIGVKSVDPVSDNLGSNYVTINHNMCDFGHVTYSLFASGFPIYKVNMKIISTS